MSASSKLNQRIAKWDNAKAFLILMVVFGHALTPYVDSGGLMHSVTLFLYSFHMPLFIFISGMFAKSTINSKPFRYEKVISYILLFFFMKTTIYLVQMIFSKNPAIDLKFLLDEKGTPWYIFVMAVHILISRALRRLNPIAVMVVSTLLSLAVGYINFIDDTLILSRIIVFFPIFHLGYLLDRDKVLKILNKPVTRILSSVFLIGFVAFLLLFTDKIYSLRYVFTGNNPYFEFGEDWYPFGALLRLFCYGVSFATSAAILSVLPNKEIPVFSFCGTRTLPVYAFHRQILFALQYSFLGVYLGTLNPNLIVLIVFAASVLLTLVLSTKPFDYLLYPIMNYKKLFRKKTDL